MEQEDQTLLVLRSPAWLYAILGVAVIFVVGAAASLAAVLAFEFEPHILAGLVWPTAIGAGLAAGSIGGRLRRYGALSRGHVVGRGAAAGAAAGFAWPFSFIVFPLFDGDFDTFFAGLPAVVICAVFGAALAALGALVASLVCMRAR